MCDNRTYMGENIRVSLLKTPHTRSTRNDVRTIVQNKPTTGCRSVVSIWVFVELGCDIFLLNQIVTTINGESCKMGIRKGTLIELAIALI